MGRHWGENGDGEDACKTKTVTLEDSVRPKLMTYYRRDCGDSAP